MAKDTGMETMLKKEDQNEAEEVMKFMETLSMDEKKEFLAFLQGAKFVKAMATENVMKTA